MTLVETATTVPAGPAARRRSWWRSQWLDIAVVVGFSVVAFLTRRDGLPVDGLWFDDSWVAAGAMKGSLWDLMAVGSGHPGFTAGLMAWSEIIGGDLRGLAYPALVAGTAGPAVVYLALRRFSYARSIGILLAAALVVADVHVLYSGRVKGYTLDPLCVIGIAVAVPWLARITWRWPIAIAWVVAAMLLASVSGYVLVATAAAGVILLLHPASDRLVRAVAVATQAVFCFVFLIVAQRSTDLAAIEATQETNYDGHLDFSWNPIRFGDESLEHLRRVAAVYPGGSGRWLTLLVLVALAGLVVAAAQRRTGSEALGAQFLLFVVSIAFVGGVLDKFPFGPTSGSVWSSGGRHTLWLIPAMAVGLAAVLHRLRRRIGHATLRVAFDVVLVGAALFAIVVGYSTAVPYPFAGSASATAFVDAEVGPNDVVLVTQTSIYAYAITTDSPVSLRGTPDRMIGFTPEFSDARIHTIGSFGEAAGTPAQIGALIADADRVFVHVSIPGLGQLVENLEAALQLAGFKEEQRLQFESALVLIWSR